MNYKHINWTNEKVRNFWDYESRFKENYFTYQVGKYLVESVKKYLQGAKEVLDYGSGPGHLIPYLLKENFHVSALDFSAESIMKLNDQFKNEPNFVGSFTKEELHKLNKKFDVIFVIEVIEHIDDFYLDQVFENLHSFLKPGGMAIISTPNNEDLSKSHILCPECNTIFHRWQHIRSWNRESLEQLIKLKKFAVVKIFTINYSFMKFSPFKRLRVNLKIILKRLLSSKINAVRHPHLVAVLKKV